VVLRRWRVCKRWEWQAAGSQAVAAGRLCTRRQVLHGAGGSGPSAAVQRGRQAAQAAGSSSGVEAGAVRNSSNGSPAVNGIQARQRTAARRQVQAGSMVQVTAVPSGGRRMQAGIKRWQWQVQALFQVTVAVSGRQQQAPAAGGGEQDEPEETHPRYPPKAE